MRRILLLLFLTVSLALSAKPKNFVMPQWVTFPSEGEYIGIAKPDGGADAAVQAALMSYIICNGKMPYTSVVSYVSSSLSASQNAEDSSDINSVNIVSGSFNGRISYNVCHLEKMASGEWAASISDGDKCSDDIEMHFTARMDLRDGECNFESIISMHSSQKAMLTLGYTSDNLQTTGRLKQSYMNVDGTSYESQAPESGISYLPQNASNESAFNSLRRKYEISATDYARCYGDLAMKYESGQYSASDIYFANLINQTFNRFLSQKDHSVTSEMIATFCDEHPEYKSYVSVVPLLAGTQVAARESVDNEQGARRSVLYSHFDGYGINIPLHIGFFVLQDSFSGFYSFYSSDSAQIGKAIEYSSSEICKSPDISSTDVLVEKYSDALASRMQLSFGQYDAARQRLDLEDKVFGKYYINLSKEEAAQLKTDWARYKKEYKYILYNGRFFLKAIIVSPASKTTGGTSHTYSVFPCEY